MISSGAVKSEAEARKRGGHLPGGKVPGEKVPCLSKPAVCDRKREGFPNPQASWECSLHRRAVGHPVVSTDCQNNVSFGSPRAT